MQIPGQDEIDEALDNPRIGPRPPMEWWERVMVGIGLTGGVVAPLLFLVWTLFTR